MSPCGDACRKACLRSTEPVFEEARQIPHNIWKNKITFSTNNLGLMEQFQNLEFEKGVNGACAALRSIPGHGQMASEVALLHMLVKVFRATAEIAVDRLKNEQRQDRKITKPRAEQLSKARLLLKASEQMIKDQKFKPTDMFQKKVSVVEQVKGSAGSLVKVDFDSKTIESSLLQVSTFHASVLADFVADTEQLCGIISNMTIEIPEPVKNTILEDAHKDLVKQLIENRNYKPCINGTNILTQWQTQIHILFSSTLIFLWFVC